MHYGMEMSARHGLTISKSDTVNRMDEIPLALGLLQMMSHVSVAVLRRVQTLELAEESTKRTR